MELKIFASLWKILRISQMSDDQKLIISYITCSQENLIMLRQWKTLHEITTSEISQVTPWKYRKRIEKFGQNNFFYQKHNSLDNYAE